MLNKGKNVLDYDNISTAELKDAIHNKLIGVLGQNPIYASNRAWLRAAILVVRDIVIYNHLKAKEIIHDSDSKKVYYLSMEYLIGRIFSNAVLTTRIGDKLKLALDELGVQFDVIINEEPEPGLGNGGLGRLAACFLDSFATLNLPAMAYGIRYEYGIFKQEIINHQQVEKPDNWLKDGNVWELANYSHTYKIQFGGRIQFENNKWDWVDSRNLTAIAYDYLVPGYGSASPINLRLWSIQTSDLFDLDKFNQGDFLGAVKEMLFDLNATKVLYPNDSTNAGKMLRLMQEYILVSASIFDILRQHKKKYPNYDNLAEKISIHLNDTHPVLAIPELMRILIDIEGFSYNDAWNITKNVFSYTNHTLMNEALEVWPVEMIGKLLPRHLQIIFDINETFLGFVRSEFNVDDDFIRRVSLVQEEGVRAIRMAWLAVVGSHKVNGVAKLHSDLMVASLFKDFAYLYPDKFCNVTNGITPRRWLRLANPDLSTLIDKTIGTSWHKNLADLIMLKEYADDPNFIRQIAEVKKINKIRLAGYVKQELNIEIKPNALFDVIIKRFHEYKRQSLKLLHVIALYNQIIEHPEQDFQPRVVFFAGKAASAYVAAKDMIALITYVADKVNNDPLVGDKLKVVFIPNYSVSLAQIIIPATDLSEQISLAGTEASGTSNMKFSLNGALTIGTFDGANIEIYNHVGSDNIFIFGNRVEQVEELRRNGYDSHYYCDNNPELQKAVKQVRSGFFNPENPERFNNAYTFDYYQVFADYADYRKTQNHIETVYKDQQVWHTKVLNNIMNMGYFSVDRTIQEYADEIWNIKPII